ncbi:class I SAM-dependent methyltransferase [Georgenia faecalis]|uniref:class I SAM-dependent methyltransferase n=1 Tax=Georgenia faecalis TaxID=2483799 RepID=UPI000FD8E205|nr:class I SAM-dependent methyltransferase [Georgenia faecalis]
MSRLDDDQLAAFDTDYMDAARWRPIDAGLARFAPDLRFLDLGGGNGRFADRLLARYPRATAVVADNAPVLLGQNTAHPRKRTVAVDAMGLPTADLGRFDVVFVNWLLHHLVVTGDYTATRRTIARTLGDLRWLLRPGGRVSVYENLYDGVAHHNAPGRLIFAATSMRRAAPLTRRLGANTAGVGVCFQSGAAWRELAADAGYAVESFTPDTPWAVSRPKRVGLTIRSVRCGHFWLRPRD